MDDTKPKLPPGGDERFVLRDELVEAMKQLEQRVYLTPQEIDRSLRTVEERLRQLVEKPGPRTVR